MIIDWFTIFAQAINFLILVWLMKHFLYKPILNAIDAREKRITDELANAARKESEAQKESDEFKHKNEEFDKQRTALLSKAAQDAESERQKLVDEARRTADALSAKRQESLRNDAKNLNQAISRRVQQEVFSIARKALSDLSSSSLEECMADVFIRRLQGMDSQAKEGLAHAFKTSSPSGLVRSAFDLPEEQRVTIQNALNVFFSVDIHLKFETAPDLISGIEFTANGQRLAWSIADYLKSLENGVDELLKEKEKSEAKAEPKPEKKVEPEPETKVEPKPKVKTETKPGVEVKKPVPEDKVESQPEAKSEIKPEGKVEPETKAESKPEVKAEPKPETKIEPKPEAKAEVKPKADDKVESKPEAKTE